MSYFFTLYDIIIFRGNPTTPLRPITPKSGWVPTIGARWMVMLKTRLDASKSTIRDSTVFNQYLMDFLPICIALINLYTVRNLFNLRHRFPVFTRLHAL